jgi:prepilin-type N-terminal cleavage/methylation domain-containing protein
MQRRAFTLIELLIVVAIIAILAAIAVPNFLEAQTRAKVSRGLADMRSIATGLESYKVDTNKYPPDYQLYQQGGGGGTTGQFANACLGRLTTPVAYITAIPLNVFTYRNSWYDGDPRWYGYKSEDNWRTIVLPGIQTRPDAELNKLWVLESVGPDQHSNWGSYAMFGQKVLNSIGFIQGGGGPGCIYDATNGTVSAGDIVRTGP